jgi:hypothetical protein
MRKIAEPAPNAFANTITESVRKSRIGRPKLYHYMAAGRLRYLKVGRRRLITDAALLDLLRSLEAETAAGTVA